MIRLFIVDDDTIVRTSVKMLADWEKEGIEIVGSAVNGKQALEFLQKQPVDVVLTDIKMPIMDGLGLLEALARFEAPPAAVVLSAFDEFALVRKAFTLGAVDYIQKSEMDAESLVQCIHRAGASIARMTPNEPFAPQALSPGMRLREAILSKGCFDEVLSLPCVFACIELDDYTNVQARFSPRLEQDLVRPLMDFASQSPGLEANCIFCSISPSRYVFAFHHALGDKQTARALCEQLAKTWKTYMNISVSVGLSGVAQTHEALDGALAQAIDHASMRLVLGPGIIVDHTTYDRFFLPDAIKLSAEMAPLLSALKAGQDTLINNERVALFAPCFAQPLSEAHKLLLTVVYHVAVSLSTLGTSLARAFGGEEYNYTLRIKQLRTAKDCEIWLTNFLRHIANFLSRELSASPGDVMEQAQRYVLDHYHEASLSVQEVAGAVGLSEKYFSTKFNRFMGVSMSVYVNGLRITKAKELLQQTDLKVYEIAEMIGFANTEHFIRVFRKQVGTSPIKMKKRTKYQ